MPTKDPRKAAHSYVSQLLASTEAKLNADGQMLRILQEHEELGRYQRLCEEQHLLIESLKRQLEERTEEAVKAQQKL
jgi:hypothetical protein